VSATHAGALSDLRLSLLQNGYEPIPVVRHDAPIDGYIKSPGKQPTLKGWQSVEITEPLVRSWETTQRNSTNTGLRTGRIVAVDFDIPDPSLAADIGGLAAAMLGESPLVRIGKAPKALWCFSTETPYAKMETPELLLPDGTKVQVEVLGKGQQFVSHGYHPDTQEPYRWIQAKPEGTPLSSLPPISETKLRAFLAAAEVMMRAVGGRTREEIDPPAPRLPERVEPRQGGSDFFKNVNSRALEQIESWIRYIFPRAYWQPNAASPPGAWRVSSKDIGRGLEEDLSVHPTHGAQDFGTRQSLTPIDIMMQHGGAPDAVSAAIALCERLRVDPAQMGWHKKAEAVKPSAGSIAPQANPAPAADDDLYDLQWFRDIQQNTDAKDFVQGLLVEQSAAVVYGESNAGKTFWVTDLALHVAAGREWNGRRVEGGPVIYCALEGGIGFRNRVSAWRTETGLEDADIPFAAISASVNLLDPEADTPRLVRTLRKVAETYGKPLLIVFDTLSRAMAGGNENAPDDMGALVKNMDTIRQEIGCCALFIHHSGKDAAKGARGHSLLRAAIDTEIEVKSEEGSEVKTATIVKQRDLSKGDVLGFTLKVVELGQNRHGEAVTTCVVEFAEAPEPEDKQNQPKENRLNGDNRIALDVLQDLIATKGKSGYPGTPDGILSVPEDWWRERFYARGKAGSNAAAKQKAFVRAVTQLTLKRAVACDAGRVWVCW